MITLLVILWWMLQFPRLCLLRLIPRHALYVQLLEPRHWQERDRVGTGRVLLEREGRVAVGMGMASEAVLAFLAAAEVGLAEAAAEVTQEPTVVAAMNGHVHAVSNPASRGSLVRTAEMMTVTVTLVVRRHLPPVLRKRS